MCQIRNDVASFKVDEVFFYLLVRRCCLNVQLFYLFYLFILSLIIGLNS